MFALSLVAAAVVAPLVFAQDATLGIQAIKAHLLQSALVPDLFSPFEPTALLTLTFPGVGELQPGQSLNRAQVAPVPTVSVTPSNSSITLSGNYTLAMLDAGTVGESLPRGQTRHWLVNGVRVTSGSVTNTTALGVTDYAGPAPPAGSGPHRYVVVLYSQPDSFRAPVGLSTAGVPVEAFVWAEYVTSSGLGPVPVGVTYFTVEEGTRTVTISATSSVVTSTLPAAASSHSGTKVSSSVRSSGTSTPTSGAVTLSTGGHFVAIVLLGIFLCLNF